MIIWNTCYASEEPPKQKKTEQPDKKPQLRPRDVPLQRSFAYTDLTPYLPGKDNLPQNQNIPTKA